MCMCVSVCVCVCTCVCTCVCIHIMLHMCINMHADVCARVCIRACTDLFIIYVCNCACAFTKCVCPDVHSYIIFRHPQMTINQSVININVVVH